MKVREAVIRTGNGIINVGDLSGLSDSDKTNVTSYLNNKYKYIRPVLFIENGKYLPHPTFQEFEAPAPDNDLFVEYDFVQD